MRPPRRTRGRSIARRSIGSIALRSDSALTIDRFPDGFGGQSKLRVERVEIYARGARIVVVDESGEHEIPRSLRKEFIGTSESGEVRVSLAFDPGVENIGGVGTSPSGTYAISATRNAKGLTLTAVPVEMTLPAGVVPRIVPARRRVAERPCDAGRARRLR